MTDTDDARSLREAYSSGAITKQDYVERMHALHLGLIDDPDFLAGSAATSLDLTAEGLVVELADGSRFHVPASDVRSPPLDVVNFGDYERDQMNTIRRVIRSLPEPGTFFDVGANIGWHTVVLGREFPALVVHAFEPIESHRALLEKNLLANGVKAAVVHPVALSNFIGSDRFYVDPSLGVNAASVRHSTSDDVIEVDVDVTSMDRCVRDLKVRPHVVKCDVEGAELLVLKGAHETLSRYRPAVFVEMLRQWAAAYDYHPNDLISFMAELGYGCFSMSATRLAPFTKMDASTEETNFVFLHPDGPGATLL